MLTMSRKITCNSEGAEILLARGSCEALRKQDIESPSYIESIMKDGNIMNEVLTSYPLPALDKIASFDVDPQNGFTPVCPDELPVEGGHEIAGELNAQAVFASVRLASRDAHSMSAVWIANEKHPMGTPVLNQANSDLYWKAHTIVGTKGFEFIEGLVPQSYDFQVYKGVDPAMHPYGACFHDLAEKQSTGVIEFLRQRRIEAVIIGGLATEYCVKETVLQLCRAGFNIVLNLAGCRSFAPDTGREALKKMQQCGVIIVQSASSLRAGSTDLFAFKQVNHGFTPNI